MFQPVIKWSGSKRSQCENIIKYFPKEIDTYYEPFCGGASVCRALMESKDHKVNKFACSDLNRDLINIALANIEQSYEKALSRGVEKTLLLERNMLSPQFHIESDEQRLKNLELIDYYKNLED